MNKKLVSLITMASIMFTSVTPVFAKNFTSKQNVALNHAWTVKFNKTLGSNQDFSKVTIRDSNGTVVPVDVATGSDNQSVTVSPKSNYNSNTNYILTVDGIKDSNGKALSDNATMQFTTASDSTNPNQPTQPASSIIKPELLAGAEGRADKSWSSSFVSVKDQDGNTIPLNSYALGQVYTREQARKFKYSFNNNKNYDNMGVISGLGCEMKFEQGKVYVLKSYPINVTGLLKYDEPYNTSEMVRYSNHINPLAEQQIYNLVSNVARTNDTASSKYTFIYNSQYDTYKADDNGNLVKVPSATMNTTDFYLQLMSNGNDSSTGHMTDYGDVYFLETPYVENGTDYNLKLNIDPVGSPSETKLLLDSVVGDKFGTDLSTKIAYRTNNKIWTDDEFIIDGIKCYAKDDYVYISY